MRPRAAENIMRFCNSSTLAVKEFASCARSLKLTRKNSSCGFAVRKNCTAARRDLSTLSAMLPLMSKITPIEIGTSSLEKRTISCSTPSSNARKLFCSRPVTSRPYGSVTVTFTSVMSTSDLSDLPCWAFGTGAAEAGPAPAFCAFTGEFKSEPDKRRKAAQAAACTQLITSCAARAFKWYPQYLRDGCGVSLKWIVALANSKSSLLFAFREPPCGSISRERLRQEGQRTGRFASLSPTDP